METSKDSPLQNVGQEGQQVDTGKVSYLFQPLTKIKFKGIMMHYKGILDEMESQEPLKNLHAEFSSLLRKLQLSYLVQCRLMRKLKEGDSGENIVTSQILSLKKSLADKENDLDNMKKRMEDLTSTLEDAFDQRDQLIAEIETSKAPHKTEDLSHEHKLILELRSKTLSLEAQYSQTVDKFTLEVLQKDGQIANLTKELEKALETAKKSEEEMSATKINYIKETKKHNKAIKDILDLRAALDVKDRRIKGFLEALKEARGKTNRLEQALKDFQVFKQRLETEVQDLTTRLEVSKRESTIQADKLSNIILERNELAGELKPCREKLRNLTEDISALTREKYALVKRISTLENTGAQFQERIRHQEVQMSIITKHCEDIKIRLRETVRESQKYRKQREIALSRNIAQAVKINKLESNLKVKDEAKLVMHEELQAFRAKSAKDKAIIRHFEFEKNVLVKRIQDHTITIADNSKKIHLHEEMISNLEKETTDLKETLKVEINRGKIATEQKLKYTSLYELATSNLEKQKEANMHLNIFIERMKQLVGEHEKSVATIKASKKKISAVNYSLNQSIMKLEDQIKNLKSQIRQDDLDNYEIRKENTQKNHTIDQLRKEIEILQRRENTLVYQLNLKIDIINLKDETLFLMRQALFRGHREYAQIVADIKLIESELSEKQRQIVYLQQNITRCTDLQRQVVDAEKRFIADRLRAKGLENHMQKRVNIHDWRIIKTTAPDRFQLIAKNRALLKTVLRKTAQLESKETQLKQKDELIQTLSKPRNLTTKNTEKLLLVFRSRCTAQKGKMESMSAQLNMYDQYFSEYKAQITSLKGELKMYKEQEYFRRLKGKTASKVNRN